MVNVIKKIDKKILILAGIILLLPIIVIVFLAIIQGCSNSKVTHEKYEQLMIEAAEVYFEKNDKLPKEEASISTVKLSDLVKKEYIKSPEEALEDTTCKGDVTVRKNGSNVPQNDGGFLNYTVNLECKDYKTKTFKDMLMESLTTEGPGLYVDNNYYVFKGDETNNYIKFFGVLYRIMHINNEGLVKLIKVESESLDRYWDNKYNIETNELYGINKYEDSEIAKYLVTDYNNVKIISEAAKKHIVSTNICIDPKDVSVSALGNYSCTNKTKKQVLSLIDVYDFAKASLDPNCNSIYSKSCNNYNYLKKLNLQTWTPVPVAHNTYQVYYLTNGIIKFQEASKYQNYNIVIHIDGNEKNISGKGTQEEPYVFE